MAVNIAELSPRAAREQVRREAFPNSQIEAEAIQRVDMAAQLRVRQYEFGMREDAEHYTATGRQHLARAEEIEDALTAELRHPLGHGAEATPALAQRYEQLEFDTRKLISQLESAADFSDHLADRLADPEGDLERLLRRLPALRRPLQF